MIDVIEIAGAGLVQIVEQAEKGHPRRVRPGQPRQGVAQHADAVGVLGHVFPARAQKGVAAARRMPQHAHLVTEVRQPSELFQRQFYFFFSHSTFICSSRIQGKRAARRDV